jgi:hypothetical protein
MRKMQVAEPQPRSGTTARRVVAILLALAAVAALAAGVVGFDWLRGTHTEHAAAAGPGTWQPAAGGQVRVDTVNTSTLTRMPEMPMPDAAPPGMRRFILGVTLTADAGGAGMVLAQGAFTVTGAGLDGPATPLHAVPQEVDVPPGMSASGTLVFQVPEEASALRLSMTGLETPIDLALGAADETEHGHTGADGAP